MVRPTCTDGGESVLIDAGRIDRELDALEVEELTRTPILRPLAPGILDRCPCLAPRGRGVRLYYSPWHLLSCYPPKQQRAIEALQAFLHNQTPVVFRLGPQESLFIDNGRMLHGRTSFAPESPRHLERVWIGPSPDRTRIGPTEGEHVC